MTSDELPIGREIDYTPDVFRIYCSDRWGYYYGQFDEWIKAWDFTEEEK